MLKTLFKNWWVLLLKGIAIIIFGVLAFLNPGVTALALVTWFGIFLLLDGILSLFATLKGWKEHEDKWFLVLEGGISLVLGILLLARPGAGMFAAVLYVGFWAILSGVARIAMAIQLRKQIDNEWLLAASGLLSVLLGVVVIGNPGAGLASVMWMIGLVAVLLGILLIAVALKLRGMGSKVSDLAEAARARHSA